MSDVPRQWGAALKAVDPDMPYGMRRALHVAAHFFGGEIGFLDLYVSSCRAGDLDELAAEGLVVRRLRLTGPSWRVTRAGYRLLADAGLR